MYAIITHDHLKLNDLLGDEFDRTNYVIVNGPQVAPLVRFRCYDDDGELYYSGLATDDSALEEVFTWAGRDSGATRLDIHKNGAWRTEIG